MDYRPSRPVLVVDDADADHEALVRAFAAVAPGQSIIRVRSAEAALELLTARGGVMPAYALVDLNLPGRSGLSLLAELRRHHALRALPVIVLTSSADPRDVCASYRAGASGFLAKPFELVDLRRRVELLHRYWSEVMSVPGEDDLREAASA